MIKTFIDVANLTKFEMPKPLPPEISLKCQKAIAANPGKTTFCYEKDRKWKIHSFSRKVADRWMTKLLNEGIRVWGQRV